MSNIVIEQIAVKDLVPYENNPRINTDAVQPVAKSIKKFGFRVPIIIDSNNVIVAGHTRYEASKELGITEVPCIRITDLDEKKIREFRIVDNKAHELSSWDYILLKKELDYLDDADFSGLDEMIKQESLEQFYGDLGIMPIDSVPEKKRTKVYDDETETMQFQLGNYTIDITQSEYKRFMKCYDNFVKINKINFGFIAEILENGGLNYESEVY